MEKIRISRGIEIEVNDEGETIVLNTNDIDFMFKLNEVTMEIDKIVKEGAAKEKALSLKKPTKNIGNLTDLDYEFRKLYHKYFGKIRSAMDKFLGEGACKKIFGEANSWDMWDEFIGAITPILQEAGVMDKDVNAAIAEKYGADDEDTLK